MKRAGDVGEYKFMRCRWLSVNGQTRLLKMAILNKNYISEILYFYSSISKMHCYAENTSVSM